MLVLSVVEYSIQTSNTSCIFSQHSMQTSYCIAIRWMMNLSTSYPYTNSLEFIFTCDGPMEEITYFPLNYAGLSPIDIELIIDLNDCIRDFSEEKLLFKFTHLTRVNLPEWIYNAYQLCFFSFPRSLLHKESHPNYQT